MMKRILLTMSAVALVFSLAACGNTSSNEETTPSTTESTATESSDGETAPSSEPEETFTHLTLVDNEQVTVSLKDATQYGTSGYTLKVFLENKTDKELMFTVDSVSVNGFMCDPFWASSVAAGKKANEEISFSESDFEKNGIEAVEEIVFTLRIYDSNDFLAENVLEETFTVKP